MVILSSKYLYLQCFGHYAYTVNKITGFNKTTMSVLAMFRCFGKIYYYYYWVFIAELRGPYYMLHDIHILSRLQSSESIAREGKKHLSLCNTLKK